MCWDEKGPFSRNTKIGGKQQIALKKKFPEQDAKVKHSIQVSSCGKEKLTRMTK